MSSIIPIKNWKPRHENIVMLHIGGWSNEAIAEYVKITPQRVYQVLQTHQAKALIATHLERVREQFGTEISDKLLNLAKLSVDRIEETLDQAFIPGTDAKKHQDRVSLDLLKGKGFLNGADPDEVDRTQKVPASLLDRFTSALEKANEARMLHSGDNDPEAVEEVSYEIIE